MHGCTVGEEKDDIVELSGEDGEVQRSLGRRGTRFVDEGDRRGLGGEQCREERTRSRGCLPEEEGEEDLLCDVRISIRRRRSKFGWQQLTWSVGGREGATAVGEGSGGDR